MSDEIVAGGFPQPTGPAASTRRLIPMQVGNATVYIDTTGQIAEIEPSDRIYAVALPSPKEAFENALEVVKEFVGLMYTRLEALAEKRPEELSLEFSLAFEGTGKAQVIPLLMMAETKATTGLKIKAIWRRQDAKG